MNHVVTFGTPWLGAPKSIHTMETGDFGVPFVMDLTILKILPTMFGPRQLIPSKAYYGLATPPLVEAGYDLNRNGKSRETYSHEAVDALFDAQYPASKAVTAAAEAFHAAAGQDDWTADASKPKYTVLYGRQGVDSTVGQVVAHRGYSCAGGDSMFTCQPRDSIKSVVTSGDGTVPVASAARKGNGRDLNKPERQELIEVSPADRFTDRQIEHVELPNNPKVINTVRRIAGRDKVVRFAATTTDGSELSAPTAQTAPEASSATTAQASRVGTAPVAELHHDLRKAQPRAGAPATGKAAVPAKAGAPLVQRKAARASAPAAPAAGPAAADFTATELTTSEVTESESAPGWYVDVAGIRGATTVVAPDGSSDAFLPGAKVRRLLPGVSHLSQGEGGDLVIAPFTGADTYKVTFAAGDRPLALDVRRGRQQAPDAMTRWNDVVVPPNSPMTLTLAAGGTAELHYTDPATGTEKSVPWTGAVSGIFAKHALTAPTVSVGAIVLGGTRQYTLSAKPGGAAPVSRILWSADGVSFRPYDGPIALDPNVATLTAFADDIAGNRSVVQTLDLASAPITPVTTATTSPQMPPNGYVAEPVTVRLQAGASDGTTTKIVYNVSAPEKETTYGVVSGTTAILTLTDDARYTVRYWARDSAGNVEPERTLSVGIDRTAPDVKVTTPVQASTPSALSAVEGSAGDDASGVTKVEVALQRTSDSTYWNGSGWLAAPVFQTAAGGDSWTLPGELPQGNTLFAGGYSVVARATDAAGNTGSAATVFSVSPHAQIRALQLPDGVSGSTWRTRGFAINSSGQVAGEMDIPGGNAWPLRWDAIGKPALLHSGSYGTSWQTCFCQGTLARGIDDTGTVGGRLPDSAVKWLPGGEPVRLLSRTGTLSKDDYPAATSASGTVAGVSSGAWGTWIGTTFSPLAIPATYPSEAWPVGGERYPMGINSAGTVAGTRLTNSPDKDKRAVAVVADADGASFLFPPDTGWNSYATGNNDAGDVVGSGGTPESGGAPDASMGIPFLKSADGTLTRFPTVPQSSGAIAMDINNSDVIVGFAGRPNSEGAGAWVIHRGIVKRLSDLIPADSGWTLGNAWGINDAGQIVGQGKLNGVPRGYVLSLGGLQQLATPARVGDLNAEATPEGTSLTLSLKADTTTTSPLSWSIVDQPTHGTASAGSGTAVYTPNAGFVGQDSFTVQADDGTMKSNVARVTVTVGSPPPVPPVALIHAPSSVVAGSQVRVDALDSYDPASGPLSYRWDLTGDGSFAGPDTAIAFFTPTQPGAHTVGVKVTNAAGLSTVTRHTLTVVAGASSSLVTGSVSLAPADPTTNATLTASPQGFSGGSGPLTYTYKWFNGARQLPATSATLDLSVPGNGDRGDTISVRVSATEGSSRSAEVTSAVQVANTAPTVALSRPSVGVGYSDPVSSVGITARDDDGDRLSLSASGLPASLSVTDAGDGTGTVTGTVTASAGTYPATVLASDGHLQAMAPLALTVAPETASVANTGPSLVSTGSPTATSATLPLEAWVTQDADGTLGDLTKASVAFDLFSSRNTSSTPDRTVLATVGGDGLAKASLPDIGADSWSVVARIPTDNAFFRAPVTDASIVIVYQPDPGKFVVGGGWVKDPGYLDKPVAISSTNDSGNFGFNVRYRRDGKPMGQVVYVFRGRDGYTYTVKSNSWADGHLALTGAGAAFSAQATVTVTDPATGLAVSGLGGGGYTFRADVTDGTPAGAPDRFSLTVTTPGGALYHRVGTAAEQLVLGGGSIVLQG